METIVCDRPAREPPWRMRFPGSRRHFGEYDLPLDDHDHSCRPDRHLRLLSPPRYPRRRMHLGPRLHHRDRGGDIEDYPEYSESDYITDDETDFEILSTTSPGSYVRRRPRSRDSASGDPHHGHHGHAHHPKDRYDGWDDDTVYERELDHAYGYSPRYGYRAGRRDSYSVDPYETDFGDDLETL